MSKSMKVRLIVSSNQAKPGSVGAALGQRGINSSEFCKEFNRRCSLSLHLRDGIQVPVHLKVEEDGDYSFVINPPTASKLLTSCAHVYSLQVIYEIATLCLSFLARRDGYVGSEAQLRQLCTSLVGSGRSQGLKL